MKTSIMNAEAMINLDDVLPVEEESNKETKIINTKVMMTGTKTITWLILLRLNSS